MFKTVSQEVRNKRFNICQMCTQYRSMSNTCKKCGCYIPAKVTFANSECPEHLWTRSAEAKDLISLLEEKILESWSKN